jgi:hypothetical protein
VRRDRLAGRDPHGPRKLLPQPPHVSERAVQLIQQPFEAQGQLLPRFGQHHFARGAVKQPHAGLILQLFHAVADRRLAQANHLPCPAKAAGMATVTKIRS